MSGLLNKVILITGASSGIGSGTALHLASLGCSLSLTGRNVESLNDVATQCKQIGKLTAQQVLVTSGDLCKEEFLQSLVDSTVKHFGKIDVLVNSAGTLQRGTMEELGMSDYDKQMNINTRSVYCLTRLVVPHLKQSKGTVVNVSSVNGLRAFPGVMSYNMSKSALDQLTRCLALEMAPFGVRVNSVNPGVIVTNLHRTAGLNDQQYEKFLEHSKTTHALGRVGDVTEVARVIAFLASDDSSFVTGATLPVDGGRHLMCPR